MKRKERMGKLGEGYGGGVENIAQVQSLRGKCMSISRFDSLVCAGGEKLRKEFYYEEKKFVNICFLYFIFYFYFFYESELCHV